VKHQKQLPPTNTTAAMPTAPQIDAPQTLTGLFPDDSDDSDDAASTSCCYEIQSVELAGCQLKIRQFDYHSHNANRVWPGTFVLADYLLLSSSSWGRVLELGTATGLLAIRLTRADESFCTFVATSDVQDEDDQVATNVRFNYQLNGIADDAAPLHIPHTWGTGWKQSVERQIERIQESDTNGSESSTKELVRSLLSFDTIVASDILLYVSAYPALVQTLQELMPSHRQKFVMSWNRRMKESAEFFQLMEEAGFHSEHQGKCVYIFQRKTTTAPEG
jgi:predicted nicotinamide N-methyase